MCVRGGVGRGGAHMTTVHSVAGRSATPGGRGRRDKLYIFMRARVSRELRLCRCVAPRLVMSSAVTFLAFRSRSVFNSCFKTGRATVGRLHRALLMNVAH